jgi:hypothetical protein
MNARLLLLRALLILGLAAPAWASAKVYKCVDPVTKAVTASDTPCGLAQGPTPAEAAASAEEARAAAIQVELKKEAARADRQLLNRFPDEASHRQAQRAELESVARNIDRAKTRLDQLIAERKPLDEEAKFYVGKHLAPALKRSIDASDASFNALADVFHDLEQRVVEIVAKYGNERERLRKLWAGAPLGSMGPLAPTPAPSGR